jgi:glycosyltransferase involved in cell wall biosynthesis
MKVAVLAPVAWRTPPRHYGPWEQIASNISEGLVKRGLDVTLFATGDSITAGKLSAICDAGYEEDRTQDAKVLECLHISNLVEKASDFDIIHNNFDFLPLTYSKLIKTPFITTIHGFSSPKIIPVYKKYNDTGSYVSISDADRSPELNYLATVYNGIDVKYFDFNATGGDYLLYFGRIHHHKGTEEAIEIAKKRQRRTRQTKRTFGQCLCLVTSHKF